MFQTGDIVVYGIHGVCHIVGTESQVRNYTEQIFLVLEPIGQPGSRYMVPTYNDAAMAKVKKLQTREELEGMLSSEAVRRDCWIRDEGQRKQYYRELITSGDRENLTAMVYTLYKHKAEQVSAGRKMHICDDNFLRDAEKILIGEAAVILQLDLDQAKQYIRSKLKTE